MRLVLFAVVFALSGCLNPDDILPLHGIVTSKDPVQGQVVRLLRRAEQNINGFQGCDSALGQPIQNTEVDAEGKYRFEVLRAEARSFSGVVVCLRIDTTFSSGSTAWADLQFIPTELSLAPLPDWRPSLQIDGGVLQFDPIVPFPVELPRNEETISLNHRAEFSTADGSIVWAANDRFVVFDGGPSYREPLAMDAARVEDFTGALTLEASLDERLRTPFAIDGYPVPSVQMRGLPLAIHGTTIPLSRGLPCPDLATPCPLTDGQLVAADAGYANELTLNLDRAALLSTIVVRGAELISRRTYGQPIVIAALIATEDGRRVHVEQRIDSPAGMGSFRGERFARLPDGGGGSLETIFIAIPVDAGAPAVSVQLLFPDGLVSITEVSLFE